MVKPVTDRVSAAREYGTSAYTGVVNTGLQKVFNMKSLTLGINWVRGVEIFLI